MHVVEASSFEVVDYITAVSPTIKTIDVDKEVDQHGFVVSIENIEIAENQTKLITGNQQLETE